MMSGYLLLKTVLMVTACAAFVGIALWVMFQPRERIEAQSRLFQDD